MPDNKNDDENQEPIIRDKRRIDPETGDVREPPADSTSSDDTPPSVASAQAGAPADGGESTVEGDAGGDEAESASKETTDAGLSDEDQVLLDQASTDLVAEMRSDMLRAQAELVNFRNRVERDRTANREAVIAEVIRSLLPVLDDFALAEAHGDLPEGSTMALVAQKLRASFDRYGLKEIGEKGEPFDPAFHEAVVQLPDPEAKANTIADVLSRGYVLGERLIRAAKVAVSVPAE